MLELYTHVRRGRCFVYELFVDSVSYRVAGCNTNILGNSIKSSVPYHINKYIYNYIFINIHIYLYVYIYIYLLRERERERAQRKEWRLNYEYYIRFQTGNSIRVLQLFLGIIITKFEGK